MMVTIDHEVVCHPDDARRLMEAKLEDALNWVNARVSEFTRSRPRTRVDINIDFVGINDDAWTVYRVRAVLS